MEDRFCLIGNSHVSQFDNPRLNILYGYGASICGLYNEYSTLKLKDRILSYQALNPGKHLVFFLGQSDVEFIYYYRCIRNNTKTNINEFIDDIVEKYVEFITTYIKNPIVLGINPTVIKSNEHIFNVNFRETNNINNPAGSYHTKITYEDVKHFYDGYEQRFENNLLFNKKLNDECLKRCIPYIDLNKNVLDDNNHVRVEFLPDAINDHHLKTNRKLCAYLFHELTPIMSAK